MLRKPASNVPASITSAALRERVRTDRAAARTGGLGVGGRLSRALDAIGWQSSGGDESIDVASEVELLLDDCVSGRSDAATLTYQIAELLRHSMADLDGSMPSTAEFVPAAEDVLQRYLSSARDA
jgi:hypothetical protein